jgi:hypothetical protein
MTFAEIVLLVAAGVGFYLLLRPLQRRLAVFLARQVFSRVPRSSPLTIDVTDYTSSVSDKKDRHPK